MTWYGWSGTFLFVLKVTFFCVFVLVILPLFCGKNCFNFIIWEMTFGGSCRYVLFPPPEKPHESQKSHMKPVTIPKQMLDSKSYSFSDSSTLKRPPCWHFRTTTHICIPADQCTHGLMCPQIDVRWCGRARTHMHLSFHQSNALLPQSVSLDSVTLKQLPIFIAVSPSSLLNKLWG